MSSPDFIVKLLLCPFPGSGGSHHLYKQHSQERLICTHMARRRRVRRETTKGNHFNYCGLRANGKSQFAHTSTAVHEMDCVFFFLSRDLADRTVIQTVCQETLLTLGQIADHPLHERFPEGIVFSFPVLDLAVPGPIALIIDRQCKWKSC